jgi:hypothetical protein
MLWKNFLLVKEKIGFLCHKEKDPRISSYAHPPSSKHFPWQNCPGEWNVDTSCKDRILYLHSESLLPVARQSYWIVLTFPTLASSIGSLHGIWAWIGSCMTGGRVQLRDKYCITAIPIQSPSLNFRLDGWKGQGETSSRSYNALKLAIYLFLEFWLQIWFQKYYISSNETQFLINKHKNRGRFLFTFPGSVRAWGMSCQIAVESSVFSGFF